MVKHEFDLRTNGLSCNAENTRCISRGCAVYQHYPALKSASHIHLIMTDIFDYLGRTNTLWKEHKFGNVHTIDVSEIPRPGSGGSRETPSHRTLRTDELEHWLSAHTSVLQMVWVEHDTASQRSKISSRAASSIFSAFGLEVAYKYSRTCFSGAAQVSSRASPGDRSGSFAFSYYPKMILLWAYDVAKRSTRGICFAGRDQILVFKELLNEHWLPLSQPMTIGFLASLVLGGEVDRAQKDIKTEVSKVEVRTGCHRWHNRSEDPAPEDLAVLFARMSGSATKTASISKKIGILQELGNFCLVHIAETFPQSVDDNSEANDDGNHTQDKYEIYKLQIYISLVQKRAKMQQVNADLITRRIDIQLNAVSNDLIHYSFYPSQAVTTESSLTLCYSCRISSHNTILS